MFGKFTFSAQGKLQGERILSKYHHERRGRVAKESFRLKATDVGNGWS